MAQQPGTVPVRVDHAVQHDPVGAAGEHRGVHLAEVTAVRIAQVRDLPLAERGADDVHVACGVPRGGEGQHVARVCPAAPGQVRREGRDPVEAGPVVTGSAKCGAGRPAAVQRCAAADETGVHTHHVVASADVLHGLVHPQQRADAVGGVGRADPGDRHRDGASARIGVVQRYGHVGAPGARLLQLLAGRVVGTEEAALPGEELVVVAGERVGGRGPGRDGAGGQRGQGESGGGQAKSGPSGCGCPSRP